VGLERDPLSLVITTEELLGRNNSGSSLESQEYSHWDLLRWPHDTLYPQKLTLTSPTSSVPSVSIVHLRAKAMKFVSLFSLLCSKYYICMCGENIKYGKYIFIVIVLCLFSEANSTLLVVSDL
jgi:hypothetical protein